MAEMPPIKLPYLVTYQPRGGRVFWYFRRAGKQVRLPDPDSAGFSAAYAAALRGDIGIPISEKETRNVRKAQITETGTLAALVALYKASPDYLNLGRPSRSRYASLLQPLVERFGTAPVADMPRDWVQRRMAELIATPRSANYLLSVIRKVLNFGIEHGWLQHNPAARIKPFKCGPSHRIWSDAEIAAMTSAAAGEVALPCLIALHTAQRQADVLRLPWSAYDGSTIRLRQGKTGVPLVLPVPVELAVVLDALARRSLVICLTESGRPWSSPHFAHRFAAVRKDLGLAGDLHFHGLRHTAATRLAESGASAHEIQAMTGHKTLANVQRYTQAVEQAGLARNAVARLPLRKTGTPSA
jgi:integrase